MARAPIIDVAAQDTPELLRNGSPFNSRTLQTTAQAGSTLAPVAYLPLGAHGAEEALYGALSYHSPLRLIDAARQRWQPPWDVNLNVLYTPDRKIDQSALAAAGESASTARKRRFGPDEVALRPGGSLAAEEVHGARQYS